MRNDTALGTFLEPIEYIFNEEGVSEISINAPKQVWIEKYGETRCENIDALDFEHLYSIGRLVAQFTEQTISEENPLLSATLPNGFRIQIIFPPVAEAGSVALSIRKCATEVYDFNKYQEMGLFENIATSEIKCEIDDVLNAQLNDRKIRDFLSTAITNKKNIIISGGTSTGKTTFMNAALLEIPEKERLITCEDAREIVLTKHKNKLHMLVSKGGQGRAKVTTQDLIEACLRLRPDRIIVGELRGSEAFSFLRAINTGHPGSIATLHADSPQMAFQQLKLMVMQAGLGMPPSEIEDYIHKIIDVVVQLKCSNDGKRYISEVYFKNSLI